MEDLAINPGVVAGRLSKSVPSSHTETHLNNCLSFDIAFLP